MPHIVVREPNRLAFSIPLHDGFAVGRGESNDLVLHDRFVSREHLRFSVSADRSVSVVDLNSRHGLHVNTEPVTASRVLNDGDQVALGKTILFFFESSEPALEVGCEKVASTLFESDAKISAIDSASGRVEDPAKTFLSMPRASTDNSARGRLRLLFEAGRTIGSLDDTEKMLGQLLKASLKLLDCDRGLVGLLDAPQSTRSKPIEPSADRPDLRRTLRFLSQTRRGGDEEMPAGSIVVSRSILERVVVNREGVILSGMRESVALSALPQTFVSQRVRSAIAAPMQTQSRLFGFLYFDDQGRSDRFARDDLDFLIALGRFCADAMEGAERYQRAKAGADAAREWRGSDEILGPSQAMEQVRNEVQRFAGSDGTNVLILGDSGSGKELVARTIHSLSPRAEGPFVPVNCAAIPEAMVESELFGHEKGAFTGATRDRKGKFVLANHGTLFLDEIGDLSLAAQAKVLRAIEEGEIQPLGSERAILVNVRVVSATNKDLAREVELGRFREDLYYRLNVVEVTVPPLRDRGDDVVLLAESFLRRAAAKMGKELAQFSPEAVDALRRYGWPGNVRELLNEVERAVILADGKSVDLIHLSRKLREKGGKGDESGRLLGLAEKFADLERTEKKLVKAAVEQAHGNVAAAARLLGITRVMFKRRLDRFEESVEDGAVAEGDAVTGKKTD